MKKVLSLIFLMLLGSAYANPTDISGGAQTDIKKALEECTKIASSLDRLKCFDQVARTPGVIPQEAPVSRPPVQRLQIIDLVKENEAQRQKDNMGFIKTETPELDLDGKEIGTRVIISAPGLNSSPDKPRVYLAVSCILNITRLQIISPDPVQGQLIKVQMLLDGRAVTKETLWQVLESGKVVDAGRGLVAIDLVRRLGQGKSLSIVSDNKELSNISFDAVGLSEHIQRERQACHW